MTATVGLIGYGRIGRYLTERLAEESGSKLAFVYAKNADAYEPEIDVDVIDDPTELTEKSVDLVVEAADFRAVEELGPRVLPSSSLLVLSTTALAKEDVAGTLKEHCTEAGTRLYVPHGAVLGTDGLQDARETLDSVRIETRKNPANIDFSYADVDPREIDEETILHEGPTRSICRKYPRNVNSHATIAVAGIGFDATESRLIADPDSSKAVHRIVAKGGDTSLMIERSTTIEGVTGSYTLVSIWGTVRRILNNEGGVVVL